MVILIVGGIPDYIAFSIGLPSIGPCLSVEGAGYGPELGQCAFTRWGEDHFRGVSNRVGFQEAFESFGAFVDAYFLSI